MSSISTKSLKRLNGFNDLAFGHDGASVVRHIDIESSVHVLVRVARRRIFHHRDLVTELGPHSSLSYLTPVELKTKILSTNPGVSLR